MMRLIDVDALRDRMYHEAFETDTPDQKWDSGCWIRYKMFERNVKIAPTIDAVPVKHGYFIKTDRFSDEMIEWGKCSICKEIIPDYNYKYCPHCGARMDGEGE